MASANLLEVEIWPVAAPREQGHPAGQSRSGNGPCRYGPSFSPMVGSRSGRRVKSTKARRLNELPHPCCDAAVYGSGDGLKLADASEHGSADQLRPVGPIVVDADERDLAHSV